MAVRPSDLIFRVVPGKNKSNLLVRYAARIVSAFILNAPIHDMYVIGKHVEKENVSIKVPDVQLVATILQLVGYLCSPLDIITVKKYSKGKINETT